VELKINEQIAITKDNTIDDLATTLKAYEGTKDT
jgi:hypothetical protein